MSEPAAKPEREKTGYVVLQWDSPGNAWKQRGTHQGANARAAIKACLGDKPATELCEYVAVPVRSWQPVTVGFSTKTVLSFT